MASNAENVSIWWRHHGKNICKRIKPVPGRGWEWWHHDMDVIFRITGPLWCESIGYRWISLTKNHTFGFFFLLLRKRSSCKWLVTPWRVCDVTVMRNYNQSVDLSVSLSVGWAVDIFYEGRHLVDAEVWGHMTCRQMPSSSCAPEPCLAADCS